MILPLTQNGAPSSIGVSMRNAAQLAIEEFAAPQITLNDSRRPFESEALPKPLNRNSGRGRNSFSARCSPATCARRRRRQNRQAGR